MVFLGRGAEQLAKDRLQGICPNLVSLNREMKFVAGMHHAIEQTSVLVRQLIVDV